MIRLVISNQRGGVAKTTTTATLARFFADSGRRVLVVDTYPQGSLGLVLGLNPRKYLYQLVVDNQALENCAVSAGPNLDVICSNRDTTKAEVALLGMAGGELSFVHLFGPVEDRYDVVLIDVAPSISLIQTCAILYARQLLIPVAIDMLSLQGAVACLQTARMLAEAFGPEEIRPVALLPTLVDRRYSLTGFVLTALEEMSEKYRVPLLHPIRTDAAAPKAQRAKKFLIDYDPRSRAQEDYNAAARELMELVHANESAGYAAAAASA